MHKVSTLLSFLFVLPACSLVGVSVYEEPDYKLLASSDEVEIREYPPILVAQTSVVGDEERMRNVAFKRLFRYITGENASRENVQMTTPVIEQRPGESIEMTAPVIVEEERKGKLEQRWQMAFVMPKEYTLETIPEPTDSQVEIRELPARKVAVLTFSGLLSQENIYEHMSELEAWVENSAYQATSGYRTAGYNPPWTIPFLRRNEIHVDVQ